MDLKRIYPHLNKKTYSHSIGAISYCDDFIDNRDKKIKKESEKLKPIIYGETPVSGNQNQDFKKLE